MEKKSKVATSAEELIGSTPLLKLERLSEEEQLTASLFGKMECFNPAGSSKDRAAKYMLDDAQEKGLLKEGTVIIEPTSGNTGIGLAMIASMRGYRTILTMPDTMSVERRNLLKAHGAEVVLSDGKLGMAGAVAKAEELAASIPNSFIPGQFENPSNAKAHYCTTGPEIWEALDGKVDVFVAGVGTGGTITGVGRFLKEKNPDAYIVAVEPADSPVLSKGEKGPHGIMGIGAGFVPDLLDTSVYDEVIAVELNDAYDAARKMAQREGILVGISSGAALHAGFLLGKRAEWKDKNIVVLLPDTGERYLSTPLWSE